MPFFGAIIPRSVLNVRGISIFSHGKISNVDNIFDRSNLNSNSAKRFLLIIQMKLNEIDQLQTIVIIY